jgi:hypothetical protein
MANSANKIKTTWNVIKSLTGKAEKQELIHTLNLNGSVTSDPQIISNSFNEYFAALVEIFFKMNNIYSSQAIGYLYDSFGNPLQCINSKFTSHSKVLKIIQNLKNSNAHGYDIPSKVLKSCAKTVS